MRFSDEVLPEEEIDRLTNAETLDKREVGMARQLIQAMEADFNPAKYISEYRERMNQLINQKAAGQPIVLLEQREALKEQMVDLMAVLKASLEQEQRKEKSAGTG
jgi:DNA end-binding protein Ku